MIIIYITINLKINIKYFLENIQSPRETAVQDQEVENDEKIPAEAGESKTEYNEDIKSAINEGDNQEKEARSETEEPEIIKEHGKEGEATDEIKTVEPLEKEIIDIDLTDPDVEAAASKIQAGFKGHKTRKELKERKDDKTMDIG